MTSCYCEQLLIHFLKEAKDYSSQKQRGHIIMNYFNRVLCLYITKEWLYYEGSKRIPKEQVLDITSYI